MKKTYNVTLDPEVVEEAKKIMDARGSKLSPIINIFLKKWVEENKEDLDQ